MFRSMRYMLTITIIIITTTTIIIIIFFNTNFIKKLT